MFYDVFRGNSGLYEFGRAIALKVVALTVGVLLVAGGLTFHAPACCSFSWGCPRMLCAAPLPVDTARATEKTGDMPLRARYADRIEILYQYPEFPSGCEAYALAMVLRALGINADPAELIDTYMPTDPTWTDYVWHYAGDARGLGSAMPPALVACARSYLDAIGVPARVEDMTGNSFADVLARVEAGYPIAVWSTVGMEPPRFTGTVQDGYRYFGNLHCVVLYGVDRAAGTALVADSIDGYRAYDLDEFEWVWDACGDMAMAVLPER